MYGKMLVRVRESGYEDVWPDASACARESGVGAACLCDTLHKCETFVRVYVCVETEMRKTVA